LANTPEKSTDDMLLVNPDSVAHQRLVVALGGNALLKRTDEQTVETQVHNIRAACAVLGSLLDQGHDLIVTHGNGPQVGRLANQSYLYDPDHVDPLDVLGAQSVGLIGYLLEQELSNVLKQHARCLTILTRVEVDAGDPAFDNPSKPIGPFMDSCQAEKMRLERGWSMKEISGQYRRIVPSPRPQRILEIDAIRLMVDSGYTVICGGGGGVPVVAKPDLTASGVEAVVDKDMTSALLAKELNADVLLLLTDVKGVYRNWGTEDAELQYNINLAECDFTAYESGSIRPKLEAAADFIKKTQGRGTAVIGALTDAVDLVAGTAGTRITGKPWSQ